MTRLFITSTGTDIGKTFVTAALVHHARMAGRSVRAIKPVVSGFSNEIMAASDTAVLLDAMGAPLDEAGIAACSPWRFTAPLSPDMAAAREGASIDFEALCSWCGSVLDGPEDMVLIEGVGGLMVPLNAGHTVRDLIRTLRTPSVLVAGSYLGTLSHTLTALEAMGGSPASAIVISESPESPVPMQETAETLARFTDIPIFTVPRFQHWRDAEADTMRAILAL